MKYALLIYTDGGEAWSSLSEAEQESVSAEYYALREERGIYGGEQLQPPTSATIVRVNGGQTLATDGPFAEAKEVLGGFYLLEADDLDRALDVAARIPAARMGGAVEVRPLVEM